MVMCYIDYDNLPPACRSIRLDKGVTGGLDYLHKILTPVFILTMSCVGSVKLGCDDILGHARLVFSSEASYQPSSRVNTQVNQELMEGLFKAAPNVLVQNGQLHVTLNSSLAYKERKVEDLAKSAGFKLVDAKPFTLKECPMYRPRVGCGKYPNARLKMRSPLTMIFELEGDDDLEMVKI